MKKLSRRHKNVLLKRWRRATRKVSLSTKKVASGVPHRNKIKYRHLVHIWQGEHVEIVQAQLEPDLPPECLCLAKNRKDTLAFLSSLRNNFDGLRHTLVRRPAGKWIIPPRRGGEHKRIKSYCDFSKISEISTSSGLIIAAEYDRMAMLIGEPPPTVNLHEWNGQVVTGLLDMGFFATVGLTAKSVEKFSEEGEVRTMKFISGTNANELQQASESIHQLVPFLQSGEQISDEKQIGLNSALSEAMINVERHAYPTDHDFCYRHVNKWWVTASANRKTKMLTIALYDQGASIPITFPKTKRSDTIIYALKRMVLEKPNFDFENDSAYIEAAMQPGKSQTGESHRGFGLPEMKDLVDIFGAGSLTIFSRGGVCTYDANGKFTRASYPNSIGGTLIEWTLGLSGN